MSLTKWKEREKEQRRNDIINAAKKLFIGKDFDEVSMDEIAEEVGLGKSTLYLYFKNKEALYFAVVLRGVRVWVEMVKEEVKKGTTGLEKLKLYENANKEFSNKYPDYLRMMYSPKSNKKQFNMDNMDSSEEYKELRGLLKELMLIIVNSVQMGINDGEIWSEVDPVEVAVLMSLISHGMANMGSLNKEMLEGKGIDEQKFSMDVGNLFLRMLIKS